MKNILLLVTALALLGVQAAFAGDFTYWLNSAKEAKGAPAIEAYTKALESWTESDGAEAKATALRSRAILFFWTPNAASKVVVDMTESIKLDATNWESFHFRAWSYYHLNEYGKAAADHAKTVELHPTDPYLAFSASLCWMLEGSAKKSLEAAKRSLEIDPKFGWAYSQLGFASLEAGDAAAAIPSFEKAVELNAKDPSARLGLAMAYLQQKKGALAKENFKKALELAPDLDAIDLWMSAKRRYTPSRRP
jgi:tetratricopeptide (TPR) repeat protein